MTVQDVRREMEERGQAIVDAMGRFRGTEPLVEAVRRLADDHFAALQEIAKLRVDLQHQCEATARLVRSQRPWWQRWW
jgi:hypothetical protein